MLELLISKYSTLFHDKDSSWISRAAHWEVAQPHVKKSLVYCYRLKISLIITGTKEYLLGYYG
jgi:hypothetical protein